MSAFGTPSSTPAFGTPAFGSAFSTPAFGSAFSTPAFGTPSTPGFGTPSTPAFGGSLFSTPAQQQQQQTPSLFQTPQPQQQQQQTPSLFQTPQPQQQQQQTPSLFQTPQPQQQQQQTPSLFLTPQPQQQQQNPFSLASPFNVASQAQGNPFNNAAMAPNFMNSQLTTQMAPVAPLPFSLADRDIQAIVDAYKEDAGNPKYAFKHLLFSVTEPQNRVKPAGVSDIMWAEAIAKLEGMESSKRERLWPQLVLGFKDLSERLKLQDEVILSDSERLKMTQSNVKMLQRHFQADTLPWIQRMKQKEQALQMRLLRVMRIIEALQSKGSRLPLMKGEVEIVHKLAAITRQLKGSGAELSRRVHNLLTLSRLQGEGLNGGSNYLPGSTKIDEQSLANMQEVLQRQTEAIGRLGNVLKRDMRDVEIIMAEDTEMAEESN